MVERLQTPLKGVTFVDLDGTLISGNSMHIFMKRLPKILIKRRAPGAAISALWQIWLRSLRLINHSKMKWHLTDIARRHLEESDWEDLAEIIAQEINPDVKDLVESRRKIGCLSYIATAAIEEYSLPLCRLLGYEGAVATKFTDNQGDYEEMSGNVKRNGIEKLLEEENLRLESFITDHPDDLPTAKAYPNLTVVVNPTQKTADQFREVGVTRYLICE
ncbi:MAG: haloacid dehalogenase-like hydrolase [Muribaculaceae bacterium]|nr:haloacid dehalogenase-like hydrolase [Muribaculaceae bacterium]